MLAVVAGAVVAGAVGAVGTWTGAWLAAADGVLLADAVVGAAETTGVGVVLATSVDVAGTELAIGRSVVTIFVCARVTGERLLM